MMSLQPLQIRKRPNAHCVNLCKTIAQKVGLSSDEINTLFDLRFTEPEAVTPTSIRLFVEEERPIEFQERGPIIEAQAENQGGKTYTLLYLSNLLGYNFFSEETSEFLADPNVVRQGREVFLRLQQGIKAQLEISAERSTFFILMEKGQAKVRFLTDGKTVFEEEFSLKTQSEAFREYIRRFINVQFVSKGRFFDIQILIDILSELREYIELFNTRAGDFIASYRERLSELTAGKFLEELHVEKTTIDTELRGLTARLGEFTVSVRDLGSKLHAVKWLLNELPNLKKMEAFKLRCHMFELGEKLRKVRTLEETKRLAEELKTKNEELLNKSSIHQLIEDKFDGTIRNLKEKRSQFSDAERYSNFLKILTERDIDSLMEEQERYDPDSYDAVEKIYRATKLFNEAIKLPLSLKGSMKFFKDDVKKANEEISDYKIFKFVADSLVHTLSENQIESSRTYTTLRDRVEELKDKVGQLKEAVKEVETFEQANKNQLQEELRSLEEKFNRLSENDRRKIIELENVVRNFKELEAIVYSAAPEEELLRLKLNLEDQLGKTRKELENINQRISQSKITLSSIEDILLSSEVKLYNEGVDRLSTFRDILSTSYEILEQKGNLTTNRGRVRDKFEYLDTFGIPPLLDGAINSMLLDRCRTYFEIVKGERCQAFTINSFDYRNREFGCNGMRKSITNLSGGTASIMTVLSLASRITHSKIGKLLLIDEFHDVAGIFRRETYKRLSQVEGLSFALFAKPVDGLRLTIRTVTAES